MLPLVLFRSDAILPNHQGDWARCACMRTWRPTAAGRQSAAVLAAQMGELRDSLPSFLFLTHDDLTCVQPVP